MYNRVWDGVEGFHLVGDLQHLQDTTWKSILPRFVLWSRREREERGRPFAHSHKRAVDLFFETHREVPGAVVGPQPNQLKLLVWGIFSMTACSLQIVGFLRY